MSPATIKVGLSRCRPALLLAIAAVAISGGPTLVTAAGDEESDFVSLFDGTTLNGWEGDPRWWSVEDGAIVGRSSADEPLEANTFLIWTGGELADFELRATYQIGDQGNSGIQFRSRRLSEIGTWVVGGYQADIDAANDWSGTLYEERGRGILARRGEKAVVHGPATTGDEEAHRTVERLGDPDALAQHIHTNDWNEYVVIARGNHLVQFINGQRCAEVTDNDAAGRRDRGILALQLHQGPPMVIKFKDIRVKRLNDTVKKNDL